MMWRAGIDVEAENCLYPPSDIAYGLIHDYNEDMPFTTIDACLKEYER
jgi:hypothetical protein